MNESLVYKLNVLCYDNIFIKGLVVFGSEILPFILIGILALWVFMAKDHKKSIRQVTMILFAALIAVAIADYLKYWLGLPRPFVVVDGVRGFIEKDPYGSFPSAHMTFFTALAAASFRKHITISGMLFAGALIIGVSRIAAGIHFPTDIFAGFILGLSVSVLIGYLEKKYSEQYSLKNKFLFWKR